MNFTARTSLTVLLACSALTPAWAQENETAEVGDIVVTALRRDANLQDTPAAVTAFTSQTIENAGIASESAVADWLLDQLHITQARGDMALIAKAGGFTTWANRKFVYIKRESDSVERAYPLVPSLAVHPGDQLRVAQSPY